MQVELKGIQQRARDDVPLRHPRPGGGAHDVRPHRRHGGRPARAGRHARRRSTRAPPTPTSPISSGEANILTGTVASCTGAARPSSCREPVWPGRRRRSARATSVARRAPGGRRLVRTAPTDGTALPGTVARWCSWATAGSSSSTRPRPGTDRDRAEPHQRARPPLQVGERVHMTWNPEDAWVI